ncbi:hypothetical protein SDC9_98685 [bioreactor metagenome]|uniref:Uncharacterized protein n=1 Tax=bioreactor metagenome TaxID=1076179 RepID=A0A645AM82_9ZZZZ
MHGDLGAGDEVADRRGRDAHTGQAHHEQARGIAAPPHQPGHDQQQHDPGDLEPDNHLQHGGRLDALEFQLILQLGPAGDQADDDGHAADRPQDRQQRADRQRAGTLFGPGRRRVRLEEAHRRFGGIALVRCVGHEPSPIA